MEEAVEMLVAGFSETDKATVRGLESPAAMHFGLGMAMRNNWSFWEDTPLRRDCIAKWKIAHGDDLSGLMLAWVFHRLRDEPFDPEEHCKTYHSHWKETAGMTALEAAGMVEEPAVDVDCFALFCDGEPVGTVQEGDGPVRWETFATEREAQLEIIEDVEEHIRQFKAGEREYDEIVMPPDCYAQDVTLHPDGSLSTADDDFEPPEQH